MSQQKIISISDVITKIKNTKYEYWDNLISKVRSFIIDFATHNDMYLLAPPTKYLLEYASTKTNEKVKSIAIDLEKEIQDDIPEDIKIYSKRVSDNVYIIRIDPSEFRVRITNFYHSFSYIIKNVNNGNANLNLMLHTIVHKICFPEVYNFINEADEQLKLYELLANSYRQYLLNENIASKDKKNNTNKKLYSWFMKQKNFIIVNSLPDEPFLKVVSLMTANDTMQFVKNNLSNYRYSFIKSGDFDLTNGYIDIFIKSRIIIRIFIGYGFCFPIDNKTQKPTFLVLLKYALIDDIMFGYKKSVMYLLNNNQKYKFFDPKCVGELISPYRIYYLKNWGKSPWQFKRDIKYKIDKDNNKN